MGECCTSTSHTFRDISGGIKPRQSSDPLPNFKILDNAQFYKTIRIGASHLIALLTPQNRTLILRLYGVATKNEHHQSHLGLVRCEIKPAKRVVVGRMDG